jgi:mRNA-degrading endonuclease RelE of RelBE toxin-antitoxin system
VAFRVGDYRILYDLQEDTIVVLVLAISHRREA